MRKIIFNLTLALALIFMISFVFASPTLQWNSQPNALYNLGDVVNTSATVSGTNLSTYLICNNIVQNVQFPNFNNLISTNLIIPIDFQLTSSFISSIGTCQIEAVIDGVNFYSSSFQVSNSINVTVTSPKNEFKPGDQVAISGTA